MTTKIITWNINSVRLRINHLKTLCKEQNPDVICLQETKVKDELFPLKDIKKMGFEHVSFSGEKGYNGVAILSKIPVKEIDIIKFVGTEDCRHISVKFTNDLIIHNFYVPAGGDEPDTKLNPKYKYKLDFVDEMRNFFKKNNNKKMILVGDLNIAPYENDVWSHKQLLKVVSHTEPETTRLIKLQKELGWIDTQRHFSKPDEKIYSWWSYRNKDWKKSNRGRRLDHIWTTPDLKSKLVNCYALTDCRDWDKPSDHVPLVLELN